MRQMATLRQTTNSPAAELRTVIITPDGKVAKVYRHNDWKPEDLVKDLEKLRI